ncbi:phage portal protein [Paenibacillus ferrarius]|uniref:phage portal protein n=1 Tax=Paenibacillus ferrarius TaxID=1469647 RepID=UPI003D276445
MTSEMIEITKIIQDGASSAMSLEEIIKTEINSWLESPTRQWMIIGERYYRTKPDILERQRMVIGDDGKPVKVDNLSNNRLANGFIRKLVDQKVGYLLGKAMSIQAKPDAYQEVLNDIFNEDTLRQLQSIGKEAVKKGIAWLHIFYDEAGAFCFKKMRSEEILPFWRDDAHTELDAVARIYDVEAYLGATKTIISKVEWWDTTGVHRYVLEGDGLIPDVEAGEYSPHFFVSSAQKEEPLGWGRVPFVAWKYNEEEQPLVEIIKTLVDDYDRNKSDNSNNLEDLPNSIYVVENYGGTDAGEFRRNISTYRVAFVHEDGDVRTLQLKIDTEAYKNHMEQTRKDIYEFGRGVDTQGVEIGSAPSGIALKFLYSDLDLDASLMETEFQASLKQLRWFIDTHLYNSTGADYSGENVSFVFNRDMPIDEQAIIAAIKDSVGILSDETLVAQHPWVKNVKAELDRIKKEKDAAIEQAQHYGGLGGGDPHANKSSVPPSQ